MLLSASNVWSGYGDIVILNGVDLQVDVGERVAVLGRNGVGKTTLVRALSGVLPCKRGAIRFNSNDITGEAAHERARKGIAYVPQGRQIFSQLTVMENMLIGAYASGFDKVRIARLTEELLTYFKTLTPKLKDLGGSLSGGQQQLLALARALMTAPKILLLDEPSEGIQPSLLDDIAEVLNKVSNDTGLAVLLIEQNLDFARKLASRGYLMESGRVRRSVSIDESANNGELERELFGAIAPSGA
ncbi:Urea ABC transporter, ATPase protein UrtE [Paraburkholderia caribensis MBA4]|uniref:Urea ABC transporter, ATPase protein UrtE n=1 Tax=Paraburkholderia caribensis MBA4 TaxID=1323664 RepID=A0A0N7JV61_9BURK|nr:ABC transporter ATP-binding protein [Paraburkholderia caribensis]ALL68317.1 Urea ABC transporter, ATPase protein UrtE [Paraburkholderia caribensis MBA4]